ncbi:MAG: hypothetical protein ABL985_20245 [Casimicrobium sp.]
MTNEQILLLSRVRVGLQRAGVTIDLIRMTRDRAYLEAALMRASELTDETAVQSAMQLMAQLGIINGRRVMDTSLKAEILRRFASPLDGATQTLRDGAAGGASISTTSQPTPAPIEPGRFGTPMGATTGTTPTPVPGGKNYKRGLR